MGNTAKSEEILPFAANVILKRFYYKYFCAQIVLYMKINETFNEVKYTYLHVT